MKDRLMKCIQIEECQDCFARLNGGECKVVTNTDFLGRVCPFYKTKEQFREELKKYPYIPPVGGRKEC